MTRHIRASGQHITAAMREKILARDQRTCQYCGSHGLAGGQGLCIDHIIPTVLDGPAQPYNLVVACGSCNACKNQAVWIPHNLDLITQEHPEWGARIRASAIPPHHGQRKAVMVLLSAAERAPLDAYRKRHGIASMSEAIRRILQSADLS